MVDHTRNPAVRRIEIVVVTVALLLLLSSCIPGLNRARDAARSNQCKNHLRQIGLAAQTIDGQTKCLPLCSTAEAPLLGPGAAVPGSSEGTTAAGYSWMVRLLPEIQEMMVYQQILDKSNKLRTPAFSDEVVDENGQSLSRFRIPGFTCPSFHGEPTAQATCYQQYGPAAIANYVCIPGTHVDATGTQVVENGVMVSKQAGVGRGVGMGDVRDGISRTLLAAESRETHMATWFDGQSSWVIALKPNVVPSQGESFTNGADAMPELPDGAATALNVEPYLDKQPFTGDYARRWGPSSMHAGGVVNHVFVDNHVMSIAEDIDPAVYLSLVTRSGGEDVSATEY